MCVKGDPSLLYIIFEKKKKKKKKKKFFSIFGHTFDIWPISAILHKEKL
jgi:hypothetical protein